MEDQDDDMDLQSDLKDLTTRLQRPLFYLAVLGSYFGSISIGIALGYSSPAGDSLLNTTKIDDFTSKNVGWFGSFITVGALVGGLVSGIFVERLGRKMTICTAAAIFITGWLDIIFSKHVINLYIGRILLGLATGITSMAVPVYISEVSRPSVRGILGAGQQLAVTIGVLLVYFEGIWLEWQTLAIVSVVTPIITMIFMAFMPESPVWLVKRRKREACIKAIQFLYGSGPQGAIAEYESLEEAENRKPAGSFQLSDMKNPGIWKPLTITLFLMIFQQFSGINAVIFYTVNIFDSAGSSIPKSIETVIVGLVQVVATAFGTALMDKAGRRILLHLSGILELVGLLILGGFYYMKEVNSDNAVHHFGWMPLLSLSLFITGFSVGYGPVPWLMMGELLPVKVRGFATGFCTGFNWMCAFLVTSQFQAMLNTLHPYGTYWFFASIVTVGLVFVFMAVPETKGKTLEEIEEIFDTRRSTNSAKMYSAASINASMKHHFSEW